MYPPKEKKNPDKRPNNKLMVVIWFGVTGVLIDNLEMRPDSLRITYLSNSGLSKVDPND